MSQDPNPVSDSTFFGSTKLTVAFRDPAKPPQEITVRELKPSEFPLFLSVRHSMTQSVEFATDQEPGFADSLKPESLLQLDEEIERLNPFFGRWLERQGPRLMALNRLDNSASGDSSSAAVSPSGATPAG